MFILKKKEKEFFKKNGYLHLKSVVQNKKILKFKNTFFDLWDKYSGDKVNRSFDNPDLTGKIIKFRKKNKLKLFYFFRTISLTKTFRDLYNSEKIDQISSQLLNTKETSLVISESQFRLDEPRSKSYSLNWHQDAAHYTQDPKGNSSLVINVTVQKQFENMGTPYLKAGSHKLGVLKIRKNKKKSKVLQLVPSKNIIKNTKYKIGYVNSKPGDIVIYDMRLLHKSGFNISKKVRVSVIARVFNSMNKNFKSFRYITKILH